MNRDQLLEFMKPRLTDFNYDCPLTWSLSREYKFLFFKNKFIITPLTYTKGYDVSVRGNFFDCILVY